MRRPRPALVLALLALAAWAGAQEDLVARGRRGLKSRDFDAAIRDFEEALKTRDDGEAHFLLGYAHFLRGYKNGRVVDRADATAAVGEFVKSRDLDPGLKSLENPIKLYLGLALAYEALKSPEQALAAYRQALRAVPRDFMAPLCAARLRHTLGDSDKAAENLTVSLTRARRAGRDGDVIREIKTKPYFMVLLDDPATRRVVAEYETGMTPAMVPAPPAGSGGDIQDIIESAQRMSWTPGHLSESIAEYRQALARDPKSRDARVGLARVLSWDKQTAQADKLYGEVLAEHPDDAEALLGRAQVSRWGGKLFASDRFIRRAAALAPGNARVQAELVQVDLGLGRYTRARSVLRELRASAPDAYETHESGSAYDDATRPRLSLKSAYTSESTPFRRFDVIARGELRPLPDTRLRPELVHTRFWDDARTVRRKTAGLAARQNLPWGFYVDGQFRYRVLESSGVTREYSGEFGGRPFGGPFAFHAGRRLRAIVDSPSGYEDVVTAEGGTSGGSTLASIRGRVQIHETFAGGSLAPFRPMFLYFDGAWGDVSDGNRRRSLAAGGGVDLVKLFGFESVHSFTVKMDHYRLEFYRPSANYYSPSRMFVDTPGLAWRTSLPWLTLGADGGRAFYNDRVTGYAAGAFIRLKLSARLVLSGRIESTKTNVYRITNETGGVEFRF